MRLLLWGALLTGFFAPAAAAAGPALSGGPDKENWDLEIQPEKPTEKLNVLLKTLEQRITGPDVSPVSGNKVRSENIPSLDRFITDFNTELRKGTSEDREKIVHAAETARETIRRGHNKASAAAQSIMQAETAFKDVSEKLAVILERNKESLTKIRSVADAAKAMAGAMSVSPPASAGQKIPVETLCSILPQEPEIKTLRDKLKRTARNLRGAAKSVEEAKKSAAAVNSLAEEARELYTQIMVPLNQRRTSGQPTKYYSKTQAPEVLLNSNHALEGVIAESEKVLGLMAAQLDPDEDGLMKAVEQALEADVRTQNARVLAEQHAARINFNHVVRLRSPNGLIPRGWAGADEDLRAWWEGRAAMVLSEAQADGGRILGGFQEAKETAEEAERSLQASLTVIDGIDKDLGPSQASPREISNRPFSTQHKVRAAASKARGPAVRSKPINGSRFLRVADENGIKGVENRVGQIFDGERR